MDGILSQIFRKAEPPAMSWGEIADLTHETQVEAFGWCPCEDNDGSGMPYDDCPPADEPRYR